MKVGGDIASGVARRDASGDGFASGVALSDVGRAAGSGVLDGDVGRGELSLVASAGFGIAHGATGAGLDPIRGHP